MARILLLIAGAVLSCQVQAASTVSGTITDYITSSPAADFPVRLTGISPAAKTDSARTGVDGRYSFTGVPAGAYQIRLEDSRYAADSVNATIAGDTNFSFVALERSHVLSTTNFPAALTKAGSPYLVKDMVSPGKSVVISPGAKVVFFRQAYLSFDSSMSAIGSQSDSILFMAGYGPKDTGSLGYLVLSNAQGVYRFAYCRFERLEHVDVNGQTPNSQRVSIDHCLFDSLYRAFLINEPIQKFSFAYNRVVGCARGVGPLGDGNTADTLVITDNFIQSSTLALTIRPTIAGIYYVRRNTVMGPTEIDCSRLSTHDTVASNIFSENSFTLAAGKTIFFAYNNHKSSGTMPLAIGTNAMKNTKGDSCDAYFNIIKNPLFADSTTGVLLTASPCIGTGMGGENMGVYQGAGENTFFREKWTDHVVRADFMVMVHAKGNIVYFTWQIPAAKDKRLLLIYSPSGKLVKEYLLSRDQESLQCDLSGAGAGVYIASFTNGSGRQNIRFAVCR
jgi:hypothetical protein